MNAHQKITAKMDRLISEKEALAYRLPLPPDEVTDNNELQVAYAKATHAWPELQPSKAKLDSVSKVEVLTADAKLKPVSVCDVLTNPAPPPAFVWADYIPCCVVTLLGAHGGTGKSMMALMLAVCVAVGRQLFDTEVQRCKVLFVSLEDSGGIVRHRLAHICKLWGIDPLALGDSLRIVDGTEFPEFFSAEGRGPGKLTDSYTELTAIIQTHGIGLAIVDNASDAFAGEEIQRRQVRAFIRALAMAVKPTNAGCLLLAHVDKNTSKSRKAEGGEGYSGSTAWHNSARSRLFLSRGEDGLLTLEHQKSNLGRMREPITLEWPKDGLPQLVQAGSEVDPYNPTARKQGRADDESCAAVLKLMAEYESRLQFMGVGVTSKSNPYAVLQSDPFFQRLKLRKDDTKRIVTQCQRAGWIEPLDYKTPDRKSHQRWTLTNEGRLFAGLAARQLRQLCQLCQLLKMAHSWNIAQSGAPTAPTSLGGVGDRERAHLTFKDGTNPPATTTPLPEVLRYSTKSHPERTAVYEKPNPHHLVVW